MRNSPWGFLLAIVMFIALGVIGERRRARRHSAGITERRYWYTLGPWRVHIWRPQHAVTFGTHLVTPDHRVVSLPWLMLRIVRSGA